MRTEKTLGIIKPDGVQRNLIGEILTRVEKNGLKLSALKLLRLDRKGAEGFYAVHKERPFFKSLVDFMISGPVVVFVIEGEGAIARWRSLMGATDPKKALSGTIRKDLAADIERNTVHGSDGPETARFETAYFFPETAKHSS